jgi:hypothetical protein
MKSLRYVLLLVPHLEDSWVLLRLPVQGIALKAEAMGLAHMLEIPFNHL